MDDVIAPHLIVLTENLERRREKSEFEMNSDQKSEMNLMLCHKRRTLLFLLKQKK